MADSLAARSMVAWLNEQAGRPFAESVRSLVPEEIRDADDSVVLLWLRDAAEKAWMYDDLCN